MVGMLAASHALRLVQLNSLELVLPSGLVCSDSAGFDEPTLPMYNPPCFVESRTDVLHRLIREYPLGTLVRTQDGVLDADHLPFEFDPDVAPLGRLSAHVACANPLWQRCPTGTPVLVIFRGAALLANIVGIEVTITSLVGKRKLSQNKQPGDRLTAADTLAARGQLALAEAMRTALQPLTERRQG